MSDTQKYQLNNVRRRNKRCKLCGHSLWTCFQNYSDSTSIHGIKYVGESNRPVWEKIFWILIFIVSIYGCSKMIYSEWSRWNENPVIVTFDDRETDVWKIPFPAITICPESKYDDFEYDLSADSSKNERASLMHICDHDLFEFEENVTNYDPELNIPNTLYNIALPTQVTCKWRNKPLKCDKIMSYTFTEEGLCYSFNAFTPMDLYKPDREPLALSEIEENRKLKKLSHWDRQNGYESTADMDTYPQRAIGSGQHRGLDIFLMFPSHYDSNCRDFDGFKALIHSPDNIPRIQRRFFYLPDDTKTTVMIKPNMIYTSEGLRPYPVEKRQCHFSDEVSLAYFNPYTQINCEMECLVNFTLKTCGCIKFSMPNIPGARICQTISDYKCYEKAENLLFEKEFEATFKSIESEDICKCLPPCTTIEYNTEISQAVYNSATRIQKEADKMQDTAYFNENSTAVHLTIMFKEDIFISSKRSELYGLSSFLSNCGGLLGLFMGVSALSFIEIFYFSTIRIISNRWMHKYKKTESEQI